MIDRKKFADANGLHKGAYILAEAETKTGKTAAPKLILIATGSEVGLAMEAREKLNACRDADARRLDAVLGIFRRATATYKESVLPAKVKARLAIEAGVSLGLGKIRRRIGEGTMFWESTASAPRPRPKMCSAITGLRLRM